MKPPVRIKPWDEDPTLLVVEAADVETLQRVTGTLSHIEQPDPDYPVWAIVPAGQVNEAAA
jgi:hypothetical protein